MANEKLPRRIQIDKMVPAELAIIAAMLAVEDAGCDHLLTEAVVLLAEAKDKVADFVDGAPADSAIARSARVTELRNVRNRTSHDCEKPLISGTVHGLGDYTRITCICGHESHTTSKEEACA